MKLKIVGDYDPQRRGADRDLIIVDACTREGSGGSPTAILVDDDSLTDDDRREIVRQADTSHAAFIGSEPIADADAESAGVSVRFFTSQTELTNCGHATIAVQAWLLDQSGCAQRRSRQRTGGRSFDVTAVRRSSGIEVWFDQGPVELHDVPMAARDVVLKALGVAANQTAPQDHPRIASPGTARLLVPVADRKTLFALRPDLHQLAAECRRLGLLSCFVYVPASAVRPAAARMFAPAIGVGEDVVNANSAGCLAAHLLDTRGISTVQVEQGDTLGRPSLVLATAGTTSAVLGAGIVTRVGGTAMIRASRLSGD